MIQTQRAIEIVAINKIETISAVSFRGEISITLMSEKKRDYLCSNNKEIVKEIIKKL